MFDLVRRELLLIINKESNRRINRQKETANGDEKTMLV